MKLLKEANALRKEINPDDYRMSDKKKRQIDLLNLFAIILMVVDHVGLMLFSDIEILRWIGRLCFPIFAYQLAQGYVYTSNVNKYLFRLWIFAIIAQIPYTIAFNTYDLNVLFTFLLGLYLIDRFAKREYYWTITILGLLFFINVDYEWYGILLPLSFYLTRDKKWLSVLIASFLTIAYSTSIDVEYQLWAIAGVLLAVYVKPYQTTLATGRYFFYWFYPIHLAVLFGVKVLLISWLS